MSDLSPHDEERLGELLGVLRPAPPGWVDAAQELPDARRGLGAIVDRARADAAFRALLADDLEAALAAAGYEPSDELVEAMRSRLPELDE